MYFMKVVSIVLVVLLLNHNVSGQMKIAVMASYTTGNARIYKNDVKQRSGYNSGYLAGMKLDIPVEGILHFSPSISFQATGYQGYYDSGIIKHTNNNILSVCLSPELSMHFPRVDDHEFYFGIGPVLRLPISGKEKNTYRNDSTSTGKMIFAYGDYGLFDLGISGSMGYRFHRVSVELAYFYGLTNIDTNEFNLRNIRDRVLSLSIGYFLK